MELFRKPLINITTIFITVLVSFGLVRLLNLSAEWQGIMLAVVATALFLVIQQVMQQSGRKITVDPVAGSTKTLFGKLKQQLGSPESAHYFVYQPIGHAYVDIDTGQTLAASHPLLLVLGRKSHLMLSDLDTNTIPDIYIEDISTIFTRFGQQLYAVQAPQHEQPLALIFTQRPLPDNQQIWVQHDFGTLLSLDLSQNFQLQGNTGTLTKERKYPVMLFVFIGLFVLFTAWFIGNDDIVAFGLPEVSNVYGITALVAALYGLKIHKQWERFPNITNTLRWLIIGLFFQVLGQISYTYHSVFLGIAIPYPSFGDIGYFGSTIAYLIASIFLAKSYGLHLRKIIVQRPVQFFGFLSGVYLIAYILFFRDYAIDVTQSLKLFLDVAYPAFEGMYVAIAFVTYLEARIIQSELKKKTLFILFVLVWQFLCDYVFIYQAYAGTWQPNGFNDYMYFVSYVWFGVVMVAFGRKR